MTQAPANDTMLKFGNPETVIAETDHWTVQLRPQQVTMGSLVLICRQPVPAFGDVSLDGFSDLKPAIAKIEAVLKRFANYQKINYLMLMMVDSDVHFHVLPRYDGTRTFGGVDFIDAGWPGPPVLDQAVTPEASTMADLVEELRRLWAED